MAPRHYHVAILWKQANSSVETLVNGYALLEETGAVDPQDIAGDVIEQFREKIRPHVSNSIELYACELTPLDTTGVTVVAIAAGTVAGGLSGLAPSLQTCQLVTWQTANRGRKHRGRSFFPPANANAITGTQEDWTSGQRDAMQADCEALLADLETAGYVLGKMTDGSFEAYTQPVARTYMGTQRRRVNHR